MAQVVRGVFDLGRGLGVADPRQEEARAREASSRAERDLRSSIAARLVNQQAQQQAVGLQREQMAQQESQFSRGQQFEGQQQQAQRGWQELMQREGFDFTRGENALNRGQQESQFGRSQQSAADQFLQRMQLEQGGQQQADRHFYENMGFMRERGGAEDRFRRMESQRDQNRFDQNEQSEQGRFDTGQRNQMLQYLASLQERGADRRSAQEQANRQNAAGTLEPYMEALSRGEALSDESVQKIRLGATMNPDIANELRRVLGSSFVQDAYTKRYQDETSLWGMLTSGSNSRFLNALGITTKPEVNRNQGRRALDALNQIPQTPAPASSDQILQMLLEAATAGR